MLILVWFPPRWDNISRWNLTFGLIGHFGFLTDVMYAHFGLFSPEMRTFFRGNLGFRLIGHFGFLRDVSISNILSEWANFGHLVYVNSAHWSLAIICNQGCLSTGIHFVHGELRFSSIILLHVLSEYENNIWMLLDCSWMWWPELYKNNSYSSFWFVGRFS